MGKRASEVFAGNQSWGFLERIDAELHAAVTAVYSGVLQFDGAFETMDEAADLVHELLPHRSARDVATMSRSLGAWKTRGRLAPSMARQLSEGLPSMPRRVLRPRVDPGEAFTSLVESSPAIALEKLKKAIKARRASKVGREEREKESREKWGLELVSYIKEAGLPCAGRMLAMGDHNNLWLRLFGNRRSKTLRNRAMAWRGFRAWMQVAYGSVWPDSIAAFLKYLEERHEVPSDDRFSHDSMLIESFRTPFRHEGRWGLNRELLIPGRMVHYWTGHSARHTLPSLAAALDIGKEKRDFLGRWAYSQHGSQDYVLTSRQVVHAVQNHVCKSLIMGDYIEEEVLGDLEVHACGLGAEAMAGHHVLRWDGIQRTWALGGTLPAFQVAGHNRAEAAGDLDAETKEPFKVMENSKVEGDFPYFVTISRSGFRRLHLSGACAVKQERCAET
ncbi:Pol, partial [Symbiodinium necroappetens]